MSEPDEPEIEIPPELEGGVFANYVHVFADVEYATIDFVRLDPRDVSTGVLVARVAAWASPSCIIRLRHELARTN